MCEIIDQVRLAAADLRKTITETIDQIKTDSRLVILHYMTETQQDLTVTLYRGCWIQPMPGLKMMLLDETKHCPNRNCPVDCEKACTRVLCEGDVEMPVHTHDQSEVVFVIHGHLIDHISGRKYVHGDVAYFPAHQPHAPEVRGLCLICWQPPLLPGN